MVGCRAFQSEIDWKASRCITRKKVSIHDAGFGGTHTCTQVKIGLVKCIFYCGQTQKKLWSLWPRECPEQSEEYVSLERCVVQSVEEKTPEGPMVDFDSLRVFENKRWFMCSMWLWKVGFVSGGARFWLVSTSPYQRHSMAESTPWGGGEPVYPLELLRGLGGSGLRVLASLGDWLSIQAVEASESCGWMTMVWRWLVSPEHWGAVPGTYVHIS